MLENRSPSAPAASPNRHRQPIWSAPISPLTLYSRYFRCWEKKGHGSLDLEGAIKHSCDVYFYQLGLKVGLSRMIAGGISLTMLVGGGIDLGMRDKSGIDLPEENQPFWPYAIDYYNKKYGRNWSNAETLNLAIGQGANSQTVVNMAKFYSALATRGQ